jgi:hypothetical protein
LAESIVNAGFDEPELIASSGGVFTVKMGTDLLFSKIARNRFPEHVEVLELIQQKLK